MASFNRGDVVTLDGTGSSDPDGDLPLTFDWQLISIPAGSVAALDDATSATPSFTTDEPGDYVAQLIVTDNQGSVSAPDEVTISTVNTAPVADAGPDQSVLILGTTVQLDGTQSTDDDGDNLVFTWSITSVPTGSSAVLSDTASPTPTFDVDQFGDYTIQLVVTDEFGAVSDPDEVVVSSNNLPPVADAGSNQAVAVGQSVSLDGSASSDPNDDALNYDWQFTSVPAGSSVVLQNPMTVNPFFVPDIAGTYIVSLIVDDGLLASDPSTVTIEAVDNIDEAQAILMTAIDAINALPLASFDNKKNRAKALTNKINAVLANIADGNLVEASDLLQSQGLLGKTDGCANEGAPDNNNWITNCTDQSTIYDLLQEALDLISDNG